MNKEILKKGYYYEFSPFYDELPDELPVPTKSFEKITTKAWTTEEEIVKGVEPFTKNEAFGLACKLLKEEKEGIVWFKDSEGGLCEVDVRLGSYGWHVSVDEFNASYEWDAGRRSFFSNKSLDLSPSDTLPLSTFDKNQAYVSILEYIAGRDNIKKSELVEKIKEVLQ